MHTSLCILNYWIQQQWSMINHWWLMFVNRRAILGNFVRYWTTLDNIGRPYTLLARMKDRLIWQDWAEGALLMVSKEQENMQGWISPAPKRLFQNRGWYIEFYPPLLLSYCQHPHSPPAESPCGIDPGATWWERHRSGLRYFSGSVWQLASNSRYFPGSLWQLASNSRYFPGSGWQLATDYNY